MFQCGKPRVVLEILMCAGEVPGDLVKLEDGVGRNGRRDEVVVAIERVDDVELTEEGAD